MIEYYRQDQLPYIKDIDGKSFEWYWCDDKWKDVQKYIVKVWRENGIIKGFSVFQLTGEYISILKLAVHPRWRGNGIGTALLKDVEETAKRHEIKLLSIIINEFNEIGINWSSRKGFRGIGVKSLTMGDGYEFTKVVK